MEHLFLRLLGRGYQLQVMVDNLERLLRDNPFHWQQPGYEIINQVLQHLLMYQVDQQYPGFAAAVMGALGALRAAYPQLLAQ
jgi:hypothetical protein